MNKPKTVKLQVANIADMTCQLLTMPINPDAPKVEHVRLSNQEIDNEISKAFPQRKATGGVACVAWHASKLRGDDQFRKKHGGKVPLPTAKSLPAKDVEVTVPQEEAK